MSTQKIILFIGPDNSGKTTIANALSKKVNIPYYKKENEKDTFYKKDLNVLFSEAFYMFSFLKNTGYSIIRDREYPCEYVYSSVYNRETNVDLIWELDSKYSTLNTKIIYCYKEKYIDFSDEVVQLSKISELKSYYEIFLKKTKNNILKLDTTTEDLDSQLVSILNFIGEV